MLARSPLLFLLASGLLFLATASESLAQFGNPGGLPLALPIQVETVELDGRFMRNSAPFSSNYFDGGRIKIESSTGHTTTLGLSWNQTYGPLHLMKGHYTPRFTSFFTPATAPRANAQAFAPAVNLNEDQTWNPDVPAVNIQFSFLLNGGSFPGGPNEIADFFLRDAATGREIPIGTSQDGSTSLFIVPGVYEVIYAYRSGSFIPRNTHARILAGVEITEDTPLTVNVPMVNRTFFYSLDEDPFPAGNIYAVARFTLDNPSTGDALVLGTTFSYGRGSIRMIPGIYRALYSLQEGAGATVLPMNVNAVVDGFLRISETPSAYRTIHVASHLIDPDVLINGSASGIGLYENGEVFLDSGNEDRFAIGEIRNEIEPIRLVEGTYDAYFESMESQTVAPENPNTRFAQDLLISAAGPLVLNMETALLTLGLELNGEPFPSSLYERGRIGIVDPHTGAEIILGFTYEGPFVLPLIQGNYDVTYQFNEGGDEVPINSRHVIARNLPVDVPSTHVINVETQLVSPRFALNEGVFPSSATEYGEFFLRGPDGGRLSLGETNAAPADQNVIESAYAIDYEWRDGQTVPINTSETVRIVSVPEAGFSASLLLGVLLLQLAGHRRSDNWSR